MLRFFQTAVLASGLLFSLDTAAQAQDGLFVTLDPDVTLDAYAWDKRPIVVFANSDRDPRFVEQMDMLRGMPQELLDRDVIVLIDTDPAQNSAIRQKLHPRDFSFVLIGKDGQIKLRKPFPWDVREISRAIDKMPMRQREIKASKQP
mgnify:CR=1 FL=1